MGSARLVTFAAIVATLMVGLFVDASAERFTGGSYTIDASVIGNSFGGATSGGSYTLTSSGGESVIGQGSGGSYKLGSGYVAQLESSLQLTVQPGDLIAFYSFEENSGSFVRDSSFNDNNATTTNGAWGTGRVGTGTSLNGTSAYVSGQDNDSATHLTISAWVNSDATQAATIVGKGDTQGTLEISSNTPSFKITTGSTLRTVTAGSAFSNSAWHHLVGTYDGSNAVLYVDGVQAQSVAATGSVSTNSNVWTIGRDVVGGSNYFDGTIDEVKLFSRALAANEVKAEYDAGVAGNNSGLSFASAIIPNISQTSNFDASVLTDSQNGYSLSVNQNQNLTKGADSIAAVSGSIGTPVSWVEGTTKGLGFTLYGTNATTIPGKWSSGNAYAAFPGSSTSYYLRTGRQTAKDVLNMRLRLDVPTSQVAGAYTNVITTTGTITP